MPFVDCSAVMLTDHPHPFFARVMTKVVPVAKVVPISRTIFAHAVFEFAIVPFTGPVAFPALVNDVCEYTDTAFPVLRKYGHTATVIDAEELLFPVLMSWMLLEIYPVVVSIHQVMITVPESVTYHETFGPIGGRVTVYIPQDNDHVLIDHQIIPVGRFPVMVIGSVSVQLF